LVSELAPVSRDNNAIGETEDILEVVTNVQNGNAALPQSYDEIEHSLRFPDTESSCRFVQ
jgi:hypothetical protein